MTPDNTMIVRHYKGGIYRIVAWAKHSETGENMVVYQNESRETFVRPSDMFYESVEIDGQKVPRFAPVAMFRGRVL